MGLRLPHLGSKGLAQYVASRREGFSIQYSLQEIMADARRPYSVSTTKGPWRVAASFANQTGVRDKTTTQHLVRNCSRAQTIAHFEACSLSDSRARSWDVIWRVSVLTLPEFIPV